MIYTVIHIPAFTTNVLWPRETRVPWAWGGGHLRLNSTARTNKIGTKDCQIHAEISKLWPRGSNLALSLLSL